MLLAVLIYEDELQVDVATLAKPTRWTISRLQRDDRRKWRQAELEHVMRGQEQIAPLQSRLDEHLRVAANHIGLRRVPDAARKNRTAVSAV